VKCDRSAYTYARPSVPTPNCAETTAARSRRFVGGKRRKISAAGCRCSAGNSPCVAAANRRKTPALPVARLPKTEIAGDARAAPVNDRLSRAHTWRSVGAGGRPLVLPRLGRTPDHRGRFYPLSANWCRSMVPHVLGNSAGARSELPTADIDIDGRILLVGVMRGVGTGLMATSTVGAEAPGQSV
jgi:hypothetical protein